MAIELPKDADGREIPLDTVALFNSDGIVLSIVRWIYTTDFDLRDDLANSWSAIDDTGAPINPELMYLTPPDSWEKLEEDLNRCCASTRYTPCEYFDRTDDGCKKCPANPNKECLVQMVKHVTQRVHKLRGED